MTSATNTRPATRAEYRRQMTIYVVIALVGWLAVLLFFRTFWPGGHTPDGSRATVWWWLAIGGGIFSPMIVLTFRLLGTPRRWYAHAAIAATAPAMVLDTFATVLFEEWFPNPGSADDRVYPALIIAGVAALLFAGLATTDPMTED